MSKITNTNHTPPPSPPEGVPLDVNAHLHTPYSFCAFDSIKQAVEMAKKEDLSVIGINDFYTTEGYNEWNALCRENGITPMFNFEFIGVSVEEQSKGIRINDPGNPGRIYLSGKGLSFPFHLDEPYASQFAKVKADANMQSKEMCDKLNDHLETVEVGFALSFEDIKTKMTKGMVRERHIAKALREKVFELCATDDERKALLEKAFNGKSVASVLNNAVALENEIRSVLLKAGGAAFIPEDPKSFLPMETVRALILNGKGIPTYPILGNALNGGFTEFEDSKEQLLKTLKNKGFYAIEFISIRNTTAMLEEYAQYFVDNGFVVTLGSEHNTPALTPVKLYTSDDDKLSPLLKKINYEGACITIAHQQLVAEGKQGWLDVEGKPDISKYNDFVKIGDAIIKSLPPTPS